MFVSNGLRLVFKFVFRSCNLASRRLQKLITASNSLISWLIESIFFSFSHIHHSNVPKHNVPPTATAPNLTDCSLVSSSPSYQLFLTGVKVFSAGELLPVYKYMKNNQYNYMFNNVCYWWWLLFTILNSFQQGCGSTASTFGLT